jgi:hypothetical protein
MTSGPSPIEPASADRERSLHFWVRRAYRLKSWVWLVVLIASIAYLAARKHSTQFAMVRADRDVSGQSAYPTAVDPNLVGSYSPQTKSGAGYFYDDVLEYRVWLHPDRGADDLNAGQDYFMAFAQYERAKNFSDTSKGAEPPLVLVRQLEWVDEPEPGHFLREKEERITEWRVKWLEGNHRNADSIQEFLKHPRKAAHESDDN